MKKVLFGICVLILFTGCFTNKNNEVKVKINGIDSISIDYTIVNNSLIVKAKNTSDKSLDYTTLNLAVYDKSGKLLDVEKQYLRSLSPNQENIIKIPFNDVASVKEEKPTKVEMTVKSANYENSTETSYASKVTGKVEKAENETQLNLIINNNSGVIINDLGASVVFYKGSKIVDIYSITAQDVGTTYNDIIYIPVKDNNAENMTYIEYDKVEVVINNASVFNQ